MLYTFYFLLFKLSQISNISSFKDLILYQNKTLLFRLAVQQFGNWGEIGKSLVLAGNRTQASRMAGENSTPEPPELARTVSHNDIIYESLTATGFLLYTLREQFSDATRVPLTSQEWQCKQVVEYG